MKILEAFQRAVKLFEEENVPEPKASASLLLSKALGIDRFKLPMVLSKELEEIPALLFSSFVQRRRAREPVQYILGKWRFMDIILSVEPGVLIPRHETEDWLYQFFLKLQNIFVDKPFVFADIGTGTGAIGISLAQRFPAARGWLTDISATALTLARKNAVSILDDPSRLAFIKGNLTFPFASNSLDLIVSNPPYIPTGEIQGLMPEVRDYEPHKALDGGQDGLEIIKLLLYDAARVLKSDGLIAFEHGHNQQSKIANLKIPGIRLLDKGCDAEGRDRFCVFMKTS